MLRVLVAVLACLLVPAGAGAAPPEPGGDHPRIWLDRETLAEMRRQLRKPESGVARAVRACARARERPGEHQGAGYRGSSFAGLVSSCALAYQVTRDPRHAEVGLRYFDALLDDERKLGDQEGGDSAVRHDSGYPIRFHAPYAALAYDWLHDAPGADRVLPRARARFRTWADWYRREGYLRDSPGANYHAGWFFAVTLIAIAQGSEAGDHGRELWRYVISEAVPPLRKTMGEGGVLEGGDWAEGWQYGPLAVLEYALGVRALREVGVDFPEVRSWAESLVRRHVHALTPSRRRSFVGGDTDIAAPYQRPSARPLLAAIAGGAPPRARAWARAELSSLDLDDDERFPVFRALAEARAGKAIPYPRDPARTSYLARGTGNFYVRSSWEPGAIWMVATCSAPRVPDHQHVNAGNFVLTRGGDPLVIDPTPYGSLSSLTSNAPTVDSPQLPDDYRPSQAPWGRETGFAFAGETDSGVVVARCDYADQYRFQHRESDVPLAERDFVLLPRGGSAALLVWDRALTGRDRGALRLRFRAPGDLKREGGAVRARVGDSILAIRRLHADGARAELRAMPREGACWDGPRGRCELSRVRGDELRVEVTGAAPEAIHLVEAAGEAAAPAPARSFAGAGYRGVSGAVSGERFAVIRNRQPRLHPALASAPLVYRGPADAVHVILDPPAGRAGRQVRARAVEGGCAVAIAGGGPAAAAAPVLVLSLSEGCRAEDDPYRAAGQERRDPETSRAEGRGAASRANAPGCAACGGRAGGGGSAALFLGAILLGRRRETR